MAALSDSKDILGFFSYAREDNDDPGPEFGFKKPISNLHLRLYRELRAQLGRTGEEFTLWQDELDAPLGASWEAAIKSAIARSSFFIFVVTPTALNSRYCKFELDAFLDREKQLGRSDLFFPILYIRVPAFESETRLRADPLLSIIRERQCLNFLEERHWYPDKTEGRVMIDNFCRNIVDALDRPCSPQTLAP